jgi:hypothetical protein
MPRQTLAGLQAAADFGELLYVFVAAPIISVVLMVLAIVKKGRPRLSVLSMLIVDPGDSLAAVPKDHPPEKLSGIPARFPGFDASSAIGTP